MIVSNFKKIHIEDRNKKQDVSKFEFCRYGFYKDQLETKEKKFKIFFSSHFLIFFQIEYAEKKKAEGKKMRDDKDAVLEMLFAAFEKHQYYNIKDLVKITRQPIVSLFLSNYTS